MARIRNSGWSLLAALTATILAVLLAPAELLWFALESTASEERGSEDSTTDECEDDLACQALARKSVRRLTAPIFLRRRSTPPVVLAALRTGVDSASVLRNLAGTPLRI